MYNSKPGLNSPFGLHILLHYRATDEPYEGKENPEAISYLCQQFVKHRLLMNGPDKQGPAGVIATYKAGPALDCYIKAIQAIPFPVQETVWVIPSKS